MVEFRFDVSIYISSTSYCCYNFLLSDLLGEDLLLPLPLCLVFFGFAESLGLGRLNEKLVGEKISVGFVLRVVRIFLVCLL